MEYEVYKIEDLLISKYFIYNNEYIMHDQIIWKKIIKTFNFFNHTKKGNISDLNKTLMWFIF